MARGRAEHACKGCCGRSSNEHVAPSSTLRRRSEQLDPPSRDHAHVMGDQDDCCLEFRLEGARIGSKILAWIVTSSAWSAHPRSGCAAEAALVRTRGAGAAQHAMCVSRKPAGRQGRQQLAGARRPCARVTARRQHRRHSRPTAPRSRSALAGAGLNFAAWEQNEPYTIRRADQGRSGGASTKHLYRSGLPAPTIT